MKRRPSSAIPELPATPRRKRALSEEERALWESVARQTKPLRKKTRAAKASATAPDTEAPALATSAAVKSHPAARIPPLTKPNVPQAAPPLAPLGRRER